jgi:hypothetical protein
MSAFLDDLEMVKLTGYKRPADQIRFLEARGIPHQINARNRPVVRADLSEPEVASLELGPVR